jgi:short-subunit dehydrogenase involved in D-alanine esterification of teichoic acids
MEEAMKKWGRIDVLINNGKITNNPKITSKEEIIPENKSRNRPVNCNRFCKLRI